MRRKFLNLKKYLYFKESLRTRINNVVNFFQEEKIYEAKEIFERFKNYFSTNKEKIFGFYSFI